METEFNNIRRDVLIIDIRNSNKFDSFHLDNSVNIPKIELLNNYDMYLNKNNMYYIICDRGESSLSCCKTLNSLGYNCVSIIGGMEGLKDKNRF